jgi:predicted nucleotidyltransferase
MIKPKDFIETKEGLIFAALSESAAFLRYFPSKEGNRRRDKIRYKKVGSTQSSFEYLERHYPAYIFKKKGYRIQGCPTDRISSIYRPLEGLKKLRFCNGDLAKKCLKLSECLREIPEENKGVTGSLLVGLATSSSDIDFVVYGKKYFDCARKILMDSREVRFLNKGEWKDYYIKRFPRKRDLDFHTFLWHERRKQNIGVFDGTLFNLLCVGDRIKVPEGEPIKRVKIKCTVLNAEEAYNVPSIYQVDHTLIRSVISYTHSFAGQAEAGETIEVSGILERAGNDFYRLIVGTSREAEGEYIKVVKPN